VDGIMINTYHQFGLNAGRLWEAIRNSDNNISKDELMKYTDFREYELYIAIGWLARENKIKKEGESYSIDDTNLTYEIGTNAGILWHVLYNEGQLNINEILDKTNLNYQDLYQAIGWLSREDKIKIELSIQN
jgi:hypothetical protein